MAEAKKKHLIVIHGRSTKPSQKEKTRLVRAALLHGLERVDAAAAKNDLAEAGTIEPEAGLAAPKIGNALIPQRLCDGILGNGVGRFQMRGEDETAAGNPAEPVCLADHADPLAHASHDLRFTLLAMLDERPDVAFGVGDGRAVQWYRARWTGHC